MALLILRFLKIFTDLQTGRNLTLLVALVKVSDYERCMLW